MPSATSRAIEPVGITAIAMAGRSPRRITEPLPNCLSICARARSSAFSRSGNAAAMAATPVDLPDFAVEFFTAPTLGGGSDRSIYRHACPVDGRTMWTIPVHLFDASQNTPRILNRALRKHDGARQMRGGGSAQVR